MEFRIQTYLFMLVTVCCSFFGAGCGAYHVEEEAGGENAGGPYEMGVEVSNAHLFTSLYPLEMYLLDKQGKLAREEHISFPEEWPEVQQESGEYTLSLFPGFLLPTYLQWCWMPSNFFVSHKVIMPTFLCWSGKTSSI